MNIRAKRKLHSSRHGFSLVEVVIATGLCTYVLLVVAALLPVGMVTIQNANQQIMETEIFNRLWSQFNTTPFSTLQNAVNGVGPIFPTSSSAVYYYYSQDGQDITPTGANPVAPAGTVFIARCTLQTNASPETTVPIVDGGASTTGPSLVFVEIQIGLHIDPAKVQQTSTDPRVATRTFLIAKRDGS